MANAGHVWLSRVSGGRLGNVGGSVLLLTTTGAKTGKTRTNRVDREIPVVMLQPSS